MKKYINEELIKKYNDKVKNIPQWKIYNIDLDGTWSGNDNNGYIYSEEFVLDGIELSSNEELNKYIVLIYSYIP